MLSDKITIIVYNFFLITKMCDISVILLKSLKRLSCPFLTMQPNTS